MFTGILRAQHTVPFNLNSPENIWTLDKSLDEISGLTWVGNDSLAAVQDEKGMVYLINASSGEIIKKMKFAPPGDYEGIEYVNGRMFVISSGGCLYQLLLDHPQALSYKTPFDWRNNLEGLAYDPVNDRLLIACKDFNAIRYNQGLHGKAIYAYDYQSHTTSREPILQISVEEIEKFVTLENKFKPSAIAVDPVSGNYYILASYGKLLVVCKPNGPVIAVEKLKKKLFRQPEGICFTPRGGLFISNEAKGKKATLLFFSRIPINK